MRKTISAEDSYLTHILFTMIRSGIILIVVAIGFLSNWFTTVLAFIVGFVIIGIFFDVLELYGVVWGNDEEKTKI